MSVRSQTGEPSVPLEPISLSRREAHGMRPARIIWLDNEEALIRCASRLLPEYLKDYRLIPCVNGDEALREIARQPPDLLITDYHHPGARLAEMLLRLEESPARFPILLVSACAGPEDLKHLRSASTFTIELLGELDCGTLMPAILKRLTASTAPPPGEAAEGSPGDLTARNNATGSPTPCSGQGRV